MVEPRREARFVEKHFDERRIVRSVAKLFDHDELVEARGACRCAEKDVRHPSVSQRGEEPVSAGEQLVASNGTYFRRKLAIASRRQTRHLPILVPNRSRFNRQKAITPRYISGFALE